MSARAFAEDGLTTHARYVPYRRAFRQKLAQITLDIDRIPQALSGLRLLSHNRPNLYAFYDRDHGDRSGAPLRPWALARFAEAGIDLQGGSIELTTFPRVLGYVFNPISVFVGHGPDGAPRGVIYEVNNTFGDTHCYVAPIRADGRGRHAARKALYVSPFMDVSGAYRFRFRAADEGLSLVVENWEATTLHHRATLATRRRPLTDAWLLGRFLRLPLMTLQVTLGIHWHALWIWLRGARYRRRPPAPAMPATIARATDESLAPNRAPSNAAKQGV